MIYRVNKCFSKQNQPHPSYESEQENAQVLKNVIKRDSLPAYTRVPIRNIKLPITNYQPQGD
jgi:hypothetical protein